SIRTGFGDRPADPHGPRADRSWLTDAARVTHVLGRNLAAPINLGRARHPQEQPTAINADRSAVPNQRLAKQAITPAITPRFRRKSEPAPFQGRPINEPEAFRHSHCVESAAFDTEFWGRGMRRVRDDCLSWFRRWPRPVFVTTDDIVLPVTRR